MAKKKGLIAEFRDFISRGSVIDLAVGVIVGAAFTAVVTSLVNDIVMPLIGLLIGGIDFSTLKLVLSEAVLDAEGAVLEAEVAILYGSFIQTIIEFLFKALVVFMMVKFINRLHNIKKKKEEESAPAPEPAPEPEPDEQILLLREIRDSLKK